MSEEEKEAIEYWKRDIEFYHYNTQLASEHYAQTLLNLIDRLQKENEELKEINNAGIEKIRKLEKENYEYFKQLDLDYVEKNFVSKDKLTKLLQIDNIDVVHCKIKKLLEE